MTCHICDLELTLDELAISPACCIRCHAKLRRHLGDIPRLCADAYLQIEPTSKPGGSGSPSFGSKPPINVDALDPELTLIELNAGDPTSAVPLLEMLEMYEKAIREERRLTPYGLATSIRCQLHHLAHADTRATLHGCVGFLQANLDYICTDQAFDLKEFARHLARAVQQLRRWDPSQPFAGTRIPCPTIDEHGDCRYPIVVTGSGDVECRRCGNVWQIDRLLLVAGQDADVWVDAEALAHIAGVNERTIRRWHAKGKVAKRGQLYRLQDVRAYAEALSA